MALGCNINGRTVRFDDLTPAAWMAVQDGSTSDWSEVYVAPLRDLNAALLLVAECVKVAEPDCPDPAAKANELGSSLRALSDMFIEVDEDLPHTFQDGVPKEEAGPSTGSSSPS